MAALFLYAGQKRPMCWIWLAFALKESEWLLFAGLSSTSLGPDCPIQDAPIGNVAGLMCSFQSRAVIFARPQFSATSHHTLRIAAISELKRLNGSYQNLLTIFDSYANPY
jgi:hypothetical protein